MRKRKAIAAIALLVAVVTGLAVGLPAAFADDGAPASEGPGSPSHEAEGSYTVTYEFRSNVTWSNLKKGVMELLPAAQDDVADGTRVVPPTPAKAVVADTHGTWNFQGWDKPEATVDGADVRFVGTWKLEPYANLYHSYKFEPDYRSEAFGYTELPREILDMVPEADTGLKKGDPMPYPAPEKTVVKVEGGRWEFSGWVSDKPTIQENTTTTGTWLFFLDPPPAPATADRVLFNVHLLVDGGRDYPDAAMLGQMGPALVAADGTRLEPSGIAANGFTFEFSDVPEGEYALEFSLPQGYRFAAGETASMGAYVDSGSKVQVKAGNVVNQFYTQLEPVPGAVDPTPPTVDPGNPGGAGEAEGAAGADPVNAAEGGADSGQEGTVGKAPSKESGSVASAKALPKTGDTGGMAVLGAAGAACTAAAALALGRTKRGRASDERA